VVENEEKVPHTKMESLLHVLESAQKSERDRVTSIRIFCEESETLTFDQVLEIFQVRLRFPHQFVSSRFKSDQIKSCVLLTSFIRYSRFGCCTFRVQSRVKSIVMIDLVQNEFTGSTGIGLAFSKMPESVRLYLNYSLISLSLAVANFRFSRMARMTNRVRMDRQRRSG
jgi:hypothetical protein